MKVKVIHGVVLVFQIAYGIYIFLFPVSYFHDDAFRLSRGIECFNVLEQSPHFPGYPGLIVLGKGVNLFLQSPDYALFYVGGLGSILIPFFIYLWLFLSTRNLTIALAGYFYALFQPLLVFLSVSMLSDGITMAFVLMAMLSLRNKHYGITGFLSGLFFMIRPSYGIMALSLTLYVYLKERNKFYSFIISFLWVFSGFFLLMLGLEGFGYLTEAQRFITGHFLVWGKTAFSSSSFLASWLNTFSEIFGSAYGAIIIGLIFLVFLINTRKFYISNPVVWLVSGYSLWILFAQNPESPRHAAPVLFLGILIIFYGIASMRHHWIRVFLSAGLACHALFTFLSLPLVPESPPIHKVANELEDTSEVIVVTSYGIETLRQRLPQAAILDAYYSASVSRWIQEKSHKKIFKLSQIPCSDDRYRLVARFPKRFIGEHTLYLYKRIS